jgi:hypothetical protein
VTATVHFLKAGPLQPGPSSLRRVRADLVNCHWHCHELTPPLLTMDEVKKHVAQYDRGEITATAALMGITQALCLSDTFSEPVKP